MIIFALGSQVTTLELLVSAGSLATVIAGGSLFLVRVGQKLGTVLTEFKGGIQSLTDALKALSKSVDDGFTAVHNRMDRGEQKMDNHQARLIRLEIHNGIEPDLSNNG
jgi:hypothetical protein